MNIHVDQRWRAGVLGAALVALVSCSTPQHPQEVGERLTGRVMAVADGDTFTMLDTAKRYKLPCTALFVDTSHDVPTLTLVWFCWKGCNVTYSKRYVEALDKPLPDAEWTELDLTPDAALMKAMMDDGSFVQFDDNFQLDLVEQFIQASSRGACETCERSGKGGGRHAAVIFAGGGLEGACPLLSLMRWAREE